MDVATLPRRRPIPFLTTVAFLIACGATVVYYAGLVPGIPKTLPVFIKLVAMTIVLLAVAVITWILSGLTE